MPNTEPMFKPFPIKFLLEGSEIHTRVEENALLALGQRDIYGNEYHDGDILKVSFPFEGRNYPMFGVIRYFAGRFEIVCPFKDQRFLMGLNKDHEIVGKFYSSPSTPEEGIEAQMGRNFEK